MKGKLGAPAAALAQAVFVINSSKRRKVLNAMIKRLKDKLERHGVQSPATIDAVNSSLPFHRYIMELLRQMPVRTSLK